MNLSVTLSKQETAALEVTLKRMVETFPGTSPSKAAAFRTNLFDLGFRTGALFVNAARQPNFLTDLAYALAKVEPDAEMRSGCLALVSAAAEAAVKAEGQ